ncbi:CsbD family protein [Mycolicibacterium celeriflavum]|uniref:CsbD family protein n=1 Tax=Mycolicibacterium celeriflavum TaxID=1249101 RepID=A0A1X0BUG7_MYCCF|nr:CsbD family protein [Mycolicibacterium celeriflavum]MCV7239943.1 CsbD family protein [Mycolicibacterium celeriflavum]ORA47287.1 CsbD family protein [Mycolicibacterium celeriflavum]BBY44209.1 CsbD family protein [Mycolicibacterium celeriflavum]
MSGTDKAKNQMQDLGGKAKEAAGNATGDARTRDEGRGDQAKSSLKGAGEKIKDAFKK